VLCIYLYWREWWIAHEPPSTRRYRQLCHAYAQCGVGRLPMETPLQYAEKMAATGLPGTDIFLQLSGQYYVWRYLDGDKRSSEPDPAFAASARRLHRQLLLHIFMERLAWRRGGKN